MESRYIFMCGAPVLSTAKECHALQEGAAIPEARSWWKRRWGLAAGLVPARGAVEQSSALSAPQPGQIVRFSGACKLALGRAVCALQLLLSARGEDYHAGSESSVPEPLPCHPLAPADCEAWTFYFSKFDLFFSFFFHFLSTLFSVNLTVPPITRKTRLCEDLIAQGHTDHVVLTSVTPSKIRVTDTRTTSAPFTSNTVVPTSRTS